MRLVLALAMAADKSGRATFPVWVGSLKDTVSENDLLQIFAKYGPIFNVRLMKDEKTGKSKGFGWVNFLSRAAAETSAKKMAGFVFHGVQIKTSGPAELEKKGLFSPSKRNYRPFTDCSFFIQGRHCKNGDAVSSCVICTLYVHVYTYWILDVNMQKKDCLVVYSTPYC